MSYPDQPTVVALFDDRTQAERAVDELQRAGFTDEAIGVAIRRGDAPEGTTDLTDADSEAGEGATAGALTGGVAGGLLGAAAVGLIPGIGPVLAAGALAGVLGGAAVGAAAGGAIGALVGMGVPEEDARYYDQEFRSGRTIVSVQANNRAPEARQILEQFGGRFREPAATTTGAAEYRGPSAAYETTAMGTGASAGAGTTATPMGTGLPNQPQGRVSDVGTSRTWDEARPTYQQDWEQRNAGTGRTWNDVEGHHQFSHEMASDKRYRGRSWNDAESDLRADYGTWSQRQGRTYDDRAWDRGRDDMRDAWDRVNGANRYADRDYDRPLDEDAPPLT
jgi:hypothetical protein